MKTLLAIVGLPGVGKSTAAEYYTNKGIPVVRFGQVVNEYVDENKLEHTTETHRKIWSQFRKDLGMEAFAILNEKKIVKQMRTNDIVVLDGLRSWEEYLYIKKKFKDGQLFLLSIYTDKVKRYKRSAKRSYRSKLYGEDRDVYELIGMNMGPTIAFADTIVVNNFSLKEFYNNLEKVYRRITNPE
jgi:dephospho-CoA kinase